MRILLHITSLITFIVINVQAFADDKVIPVSVITVKSGQIKQELPLTGTVTSIRNSNLTPKQEGYIERLYVDKGDVVKKGDPILELDRDLIETEILKVKAQITEAKARDKELRRQRDEAAELVKKKHIPSTNFDAAAAEVEINSAVIKRLEAELNQQLILNKRHKIVAPFDGVISEKFIEVGQWVQTNTALFQLIELNPLRIEVPVPQFYFDQINSGTLVDIKFDAINDKTFNAVVSKKIPVSNETTRTFPILIQLDNKDLDIAPGMSARVKFQLDIKQADNTIMVPRDAIVKKPDGSEFVWLVDNVKSTRPIKVKSGRSYLNNLELRFGKINIGDRIVIKGNELLKPEQKVEILEELDYQI